MKNISLSVVFLLLLAVALAGAADEGNLVVRTANGNLVIIHADGTEEEISSEAGSAIISPDHRAIAFTVVHMQQVPAPELWRVDAKLLVMNLSTRATTELVHPPAGPAGTGFGQVAWTPDGSALATINCWIGNRKRVGSISSSYAPQCRTCATRSPA